MRLILAFISVLAVAMTSCSSKKVQMSAGTEVPIAEFSRGEPAPRAVPVVDTEAPVLATPETDLIIVDVEPEPDPDRSLVVMSDGPTVVDSLIGQVNGRPIYADEFFDPIEDEIIAESEGLTEREFDQAAGEIIGRHLRDVSLNELILAQAESGLTSQQQAGLLHWLGEVKSEITRQFGGSEARADEALVEEEGQTFEEYLQDIRDRSLIDQLIQRQIAPRVIVSWRDVQREYERRYDEFNPPAIATLSRIRIRSRDADDIAAVTQRLQAGDDFLAIASDMKMRNDGEWMEFEVPAGGLIEVEALSEEVRPYLANLRVGDTSQPIEIGTSTWWIHVTAIEQSPSLTIFDVQRQLTADIRQRRGLEEQDRFLSELFGDDVYDELIEMNARLLHVARRRYGGFE